MLRWILWQLQFFVVSFAYRWSRVKACNCCLISLWVLSLERDISTRKQRCTTSSALRFSQGKSKLNVTITILSSHLKHSRSVSSLELKWIYMVFALNQIDINDGIVQKIEPILSCSYYCVLFCSGGYLQPSDGFRSHTFRHALVYGNNWLSG